MACHGQLVFSNMLLLVLLFTEASLQTLSSAFEFTLPLSVVLWGWGAPNECSHTCVPDNTY